MMLFTQSLPLYIFIILLPQSYLCMQNPPHTCNPSACGNIDNISSPFRLKGDPKECGLPKYELECENNVTTILNLNSQRYKVRAINYVENTIWVADASVISNNTCSFPNSSLNNYFLTDYPYHTNKYNSSPPAENGTYLDVAWPISFMMCPYPLKNSTFFTELMSTHCNSSTYTYIKVGHMKALQVRENCSVELIVLTSWNFRDLENVSVSEIYDSLLYGFRLYWNIRSYSSCIECYGEWKCGIDRPICRHSLRGRLQLLWDKIEHPYSGIYIYAGFDGSHGEYIPYSGPTAAVVLILLLILGVTLPAKIILGFTCAYVFISLQWNQGDRYNLNRYYLNLLWPVEHFWIIIGLFVAVRFITIFPCIIWFFFYKFRRRHLSRYAAIEDFLQSDNNQLMPIRYSYSDIKKMTRGFRQKLGQGGYGTVYKGRLRSGYDVAVKLLGKPGGIGQDFMNEIATIGRIHHVNVVKLVGYCAERSKRALVFDYMPNGSLDKYLYAQENTSFLTWERKYEIAIGVARGIEYLHKGCNIQILHFDIKPHNILLDDNFTPKITDFGLAKVFSTDKEVVTMTAIRGTIGYVAPELINRGFGGVSYKADVYSFGMLLMEMVGLNKHRERNNQASSQYFPCWIYDCFEQGHDIEFGVMDDDNNDTNREIAKKMTIVALWCIQMSPGDRPSMNKVVEMLEGQMERLRIPSRASVSAQIAVKIDEDQSWSSYSTDSTPFLSHECAPTIDITVEDKRF